MFEQKRVMDNFVYTPLNNRHKGKIYTKEILDLINSKKYN